ncbi:T9SS type A sorting domain-containing protein [Algoriphagus chordae]|uniref:Putative secreted protein (Por secretion system target) n=1 Tax=Algoriphagus chordae TaxID=237019 RepID=A0A2W7REE1_9BACT|nr:T9SS type A sorting domain-containing protein [Algoriphagus chordae]PZX56740.1 putative secreted protein (Por secretion system target) [Algoriphagus chordae]
MRKFCIIIFLLGFSELKAQDIYSLNQHPDIEVNGEILKAPFAGGINAAQIQKIDLTGDGIEEWVTWDINSRQVLVFKNEEESFTHLPEISYLLPADIAGFLVFEDFDGDGKKDLFTATALGIKVYKNTSNGSQISWTIAQNFLRIDNGGNIQVNNLDTPLIQDLDADGDLDIVIFNFASGDYLEFYKNTSVERKGTADVDGFAFPEVYWGDFVFCGCADFSFGKTCSGSPLAKINPSLEGSRVEHAGGHSILYSDFSGDGVSDLVLGRDECSVLYYLENIGTESQPVFTKFSNQLPGYEEFPTFPIFHIGQRNNDELIISLNSNEAAYNFDIDYENSIVKMDKEGNFDFGFLQNQLLDLGENTKPIFLGSNNSGEILVSANTTREGEVRSEISRFQFNKEKITLVERDYLNLSNLKLLDAQIIKTVSTAGNEFTLVSGIQFDDNFPTQVIYQLQNESFIPFTLSGYSPSRGDYLSFFNYQKSDYFLVAGQNGSLALYQVDLDSQSASLLESNFLGFEDNPANRNLSVAVLQTENPDLYAVDQLGEILKISNFMESDLREQILVKIGNQNLPTLLGRKNWIAVVNPLFNEKPDLILGTGAGGMIYLNSEDPTNPDEDDFRVLVYPNPSDGPIKVISNMDAKGRLINSLGQELLSDIIFPENTQVEIQAGFLAPGLYILSLEVGGKFQESRKIWMR